ncbi:MAG: beta strand repeat-containing protein, partial [Gemmatimonadales bacterium]
TPQAGVVGQTLDVPLEVEVRGSDNLPVGGVRVRFHALSGGVPIDTVLTSDGAGRARVLAVLGPTAGAQSVQATLPAFPGVKAVTFELTALAGPIAAATSLISVATGTVASGSDALLTLRGKDANGNDVTTGGLPVVFTAATGSGVSTGSIGPTTDNGDGTYSATFTGVLVGTATTIGATIDGQAVTTTLPTISVLPGPISTATSLVAVGTATVASGTATLLTLQGKDAAGNAVTTGGAAVAFTTSVTGVGTLGPTMDQDDGTYSASFTGVSIGSTAIGAVINDAAVTSTPLPTINVVAGAIDSIAVTPLSATLDALGATQQFTAQAFDVNRNPVSGATFTWGTSNGLIASVDNTGLVTAVANGTATITATADGVTGAATLSIAQVVASVTMTPQAQTLNSLNATQQFTAQAFDRLGQSLTPQPTFTWSSLNTLVARVNQAGLATSLANGTSQIIAASGGVADTADLTVQQVVASVSVTPTNVLLGTTEKVQLAAKALDAGGSTVTGVTFMWATNAVLVATVEPTTGLVTAVGLGTADITATTGSTTGIAKVTVELVATATRLVFIQQPPSPVFLGEPFTVQVAAQDNLGRTVAGTSGSVVLIESASSASTVQGTLTQPLVNGVATFTDLFVNGTGSMAIDATAGSLAGTSNLFQVVD